MKQKLKQERQATWTRNRQRHRVITLTNSKTRNTCEQWPDNQQMTRHMPGPHDNRESHDRQEQETRHKTHTVTHWSSIPESFSTLPENYFCFLGLILVAITPWFFVHLITSHLFFKFHFMWNAILLWLN